MKWIGCLRSIDGRRWAGDKGRRALSMGLVRIDWMGWVEWVGLDWIEREGKGMGSGGHAIRLDDND